MSDREAVGPGPEFRRGQAVRLKRLPLVTGLVEGLFPLGAPWVAVWMPGRYTWVTPASDWEPAEEEPVCES